MPKIIKFCFVFYFYTFSRVISVTIDRGSYILKSIAQRNCVQNYRTRLDSTSKVHGILLWARNVQVQYQLYKKTVQAFEQAFNKVGLKINSKKTKMMKLLENEGSVDDDNDENIMFEKANEFQYLGVMLGVKIE